MLALTNYAAVLPAHVKINVAPGGVRYAHLIFLVWGVKEGPDTAGSRLPSVDDVIDGHAMAGAHDGHEENDQAGGPQDEEGGSNGRRVWHDRVHLHVLRQFG